jgi:hypothetical protein
MRTDSYIVSKGRYESTLLAYPEMYSGHLGIIGVYIFRISTNAQHYSRALWFNATPNF